MILKCDYCGDEFSIPNYLYKKKIKAGQTKFFCSKQCLGASKRKRKYIECKQCGKIFYPKDNEQKFCSRDCYLKEHEITNKVKQCAYCENKFVAYRSNLTYCSHECSIKDKHYPSGENHPMWKGGFKQNRGYDYCKWRKEVLERDKNKCRCCGATEDLHAHHIWAWALHPDMRYEINNGLTLCANCHKEVHKLYGYEYNGEMLPTNY